MYCQVMVMLWYFSVLFYNLLLENLFYRIIDMLHVQMSFVISEK